MMKDFYTIIKGAERELNAKTLTDIAYIANTVCLLYANFGVEDRV